MSQSCVTDYFSTRKRNRFADEMLINKQKKTQNLLDSPESTTTERVTRSRAKQLNAVPEPVQNQTEKDEKKQKAAEKREELKARLKRMDDKLSRLNDKSKEKPIENEAKQAEAVSEAPAPTAQKGKRVNKAELKQKIEQFNRNLMAIQQQQAEATPKEPEPKPEPTPVVEIPAFQKFKDLASSEVDHTQTLTLPKSYTLVFDSFRASDTIIKFLFNRNELCSFLKLRLAIQNITKHTFTLKGLAQIKTVYEEAYTYEYKKIFIDFKNDLHLIISPNLKEIDLNEQSGLREFTPAILMRRLNKFKTSLLERVKKLHNEFLESIGIKDVPIENIKRWHQKFDLENIKEIEEAELPKPPTDESIKCKSGQELLSIAKDIYSSRIKEAIQTTVQAEEPVKKEAVKAPEPVAKDPSEMTPDELRMAKLKEKSQNNYSSLLEKIRAKEKEKSLRTMIMNSDKEKNLEKLQNYKLATRFLDFFYNSEKKSTLDFDKVCAKMHSNMSAKLNEMECRQLILDMIELDEIFADGAAKWLKIVKVRNVQYLSMDKSFKLSELIAKCEKSISDASQ